MNKPYRIAYLSLESVHESNASNVHVNEIINGLRKRDVSVQLYNPPVNKNKKTSFLRKLLNYFLVQYDLIKNIKHVDLIYVRSHFMAFLSSFVAKLFSVPVIHEVNGPYDDLFITHPKFKLFKVPLVFLQRSQYKLASHLLPVTEKLSEWLRDQTQHNRITVISNGANTDLFNPDAGKPENPIQGKYVLFFGSMAKWHDLETVIASTCDPNWPKDVKLALLGNGMDQLQDKRVTNNSNIIVVGYQDYHKMPRYISQALAGLVIIADFAGRSQKGLAPLKLYETLACGVPAIVTDYPGQAEFVRNNECGLVVAPESSAELAAAVKFLAEHEAEAKRYGENGRKVLEEKHSWWKLSGDVYNIIVNCVKDK